METFPWEDGDPPDGSGAFVAQVQAQAARSVWVGVDVGVGSSAELGVACSWIGGHGWEMPGRKGDAHEAAPPDSDVEVVSQEQLDLSLTDITKYSTYSKLWRTLYFVNDAPFCIHNHGSAAGESTGPLLVSETPSKLQCSSSGSL